MENSNFPIEFYLPDAKDNEFLSTLNEIFNNPPVEGLDHNNTKPSQRPFVETSHQASNPQSSASLDPPKQVQAQNHSLSSSLSPLTSIRGKIQHSPVSQNSPNFGMAANANPLSTDKDYIKYMLKLPPSELNSRLNSIDPADPKKANSQPKPPTVSDNTFSLEELLDPSYSNMLISKVNHHISNSPAVSRLELNPKSFKSDFNPRTTPSKQLPFDSSSSANSKNFAFSKSANSSNQLYNDTGYFNSSAETALENNLLKDLFHLELSTPELAYLSNFNNNTSSNNRHVSYDNYENFLDSYLGLQGKKGGNQPPPNDYNQQQKPFKNSPFTDPNFQRQYDSGNANDTNHTEFASKDDVENNSRNPSFGSKNNYLVDYLFYNNNNSNSDINNNNTNVNTISNINSAKAKPGVYQPFFDPKLEQFPKYSQNFKNDAALAPSSLNGSSSNSYSPINDTFDFNANRISPQPAAGLTANLPAKPKNKRLSNLISNSKADFGNKKQKDNTKKRQKVGSNPPLVNSPSPDPNFTPFSSSSNMNINTNTNINMNMLPQSATESKIDFYLNQSGSSAGELNPGLIHSRASSQYSAKSVAPSPNSSVADGTSVIVLKNLDKPKAAPKAKPTKRKIEHNLIEKRYRCNINNRIMELMDAVPVLSKAKKMQSKESKGDIKPNKTSVPSASASASLEAGSSNQDDYMGNSMSTGASQLGDDGIGMESVTKLNKATILGKATEYIYKLRHSNERNSRHVDFLARAIESLPNGYLILDKVLNDLNESFISNPIDLPRQDHFKPKLKPKGKSKSKPKLKKQNNK